MCCEDTIKSVSGKIWSKFLVSGFFFEDFYLFFRERVRERGREGDTHRLSAFHTLPSQGLGCNPGMWPVPGLGIKLVTFHFVGLWATNWATQVRAASVLLINICSCSKGGIAKSFTDLRLFFQENKHFILVRSL